MPLFSEPRTEDPKSAIVQYFNVVRSSQSFPL